VHRDAEDAAELDETLRSLGEPSADAAGAERYRVRLESFEGPLDLLLYLVRRDEINIYDIPIARITQEYLEYLSLMKLLDLELAGEFLLMAATLVRLKARMLVPRERGEEEDEEIEDPRQELARLLREHAHFQGLGTELGELAERESHLFARAGEAPRPGEGAEPEYREATLFDLLTALRAALAAAPARGGWQVAREEVTIEEMMERLQQELAGQGRTALTRLIRPGASRTELVVLFLALLELARQGTLQVGQIVPFGEIWLSWRAA